MTVQFESKDPLTAAELQHLLRQDFNGEVLKGDPNNPDAGAKVTEKSPLTPWMLLITGAFTAYGEIRAYEAEIDARKIKSAEDFQKLVEGLNTSFDHAAALMKEGK